jgi:hypothetical protein
LTCRGVSTVTTVTTVVFFFFFVFPFVLAFLPLLCFILQRSLTRVGTCPVVLVIVFLLVIVTSYIYLGRPFGIRHFKA